MNKYEKLIQPLIRKQLRKRIAGEQGVHTWFRNEMVQSKKDFRAWMEERNQDGNQAN